MVLEIDHVRVIDDGLAARRQSPLGAAGQEELTELAQAAPEEAGGLNIELLEASFQLLAPQADRLAERFYEKLFDVAPSVRGLFPDDIAGQRKALIASIGAIVSSLRSPDSLGEYLGALGLRHAGYGAVEGHYDVVGQVLLETMAELAGDLWNDELQSAWTTAYGAIKGLMLEAAQEAPALSIAA
jgi:nitric oxide dioxygenase